MALGINHWYIKLICAIELRRYNLIGHTGLVTEN